MLATEYSQYYNIPPQAEGESDYDFKRRVGGVLRDMGHIVEAREAANDQRYEAGGDTVTGITGAVSQALQGVNYHSSGARQVDDDFTAGVVSQAPKQDSEMALLALLLFGGR